MSPKTKHRVDALINAPPVISIVLANIYWASAKLFLICIASSLPPPNKSGRQALLRSHFTEEAEMRDWVVADLLVIIICPPAAPAGGTVTQWLNKNVNIGWHFSWRWKVKKHQLWQKHIFLPPDMPVSYSSITSMQHNSPTLSLVVNSDTGIQPHAVYLTITTTTAIAKLLSISVVLPFPESHIDEGVRFFHWGHLWDSPTFWSRFVIPPLILLTHILSEGWATICFFSHLLMDIWAISSVWLLHVGQPGTIEHRFFCRHRLLFLVDNILWWDCWLVC